MFTLIVVALCVDSKYDVPTCRYILYLLVKNREIFLDVLIIEDGCNKANKTNSRIQYIKSNI